MKIRLRYFASVREALETGSEVFDCNASTVAELRDALVARGGAYARVLAGGRSLRAALNQTLVDDTAALSEDCEVAFFPPVTGG
jgi:molybdopterin synthase sulfur carrier subunit